MKYGAKFKIGDLVQIIISGRGTPPEDRSKKVKITEIGIYKGNNPEEVGYKIYPKLGNSLTGKYEGFIGESSFKLIKIIQEIW